MYCSGYYAKPEVLSALHFLSHKVVWVFQEQQVLVLALDWSWGGPSRCVYDEYINNILFPSNTNSTI
jgi:hypothetical protein